MLPGLYRTACGHRHCYRRAYATGDFKNDLTDNIPGMNSDELIGTFTWLEFFRKQEHYRFVGYLEGSALIADPTADPTGSGNGLIPPLFLG